MPQPPESRTAADERMKLLLDAKDRWIARAVAAEDRVAELEAELDAERRRHDWTIDPATGRSNSSPRYRELRKEIGRLIRDDAFTLLHGGSESTAGLILAQLAHKHNVGPLEGR